MAFTCPVFLLVIFLTCCDYTLGLTLQTKLGKIKGLSNTLTIQGIQYNYSEFRKIPFAKPPVGNLRFEKPIKFGPWDELHDATEFGPSCVQYLYPEMAAYLPNVNTSEDCLFLNIYIPSDTSRSNKKSVMIWIHGGGYEFGQGMFTDGSYLSVIGDVIVVTLNYRLNIFGFLSTNDALMAGNYGLWDQKLAIQWVKDNIESFGGDSRSVTIFGESAGAFSVMLQSIHSGNKGLFQRVIAQSGTADSILSTSSKSRSLTQKIADSLNCDSLLTKETVECLKSKSTKDIYQAYREHSSSGNMTNLKDKTLDIHLALDYAPVVDRQFLKDSPVNIMKNRNSPEFNLYKSLDIIVGNDESEGSLILDYLEPLKKSLPFNIKDGISSNYFCKHIVPQFVEDYFGDNLALALSICMKYYSKGSLQEQGQNVVNFYGDMTMYMPAVQSLNSHALRNYNSKQFQFLNKRRSVFSPQQDSYPWFKEAGHSAESAYLFPPGQSSNNIEDDVNTRFAKTLMKYWSNFAKTGDVNSAGLPRWPTYNLITKQYALLDVNVTTKNNLYQDRVDFWLTQLILFHNN
ncbi:carboxylesterase 5A-like [Mytilus californianus]|uniref:carboxylesterase 5A-like n=1 Tax=Mytilus californianus TaxID=6549 RepID=UPI0022477EE5|nr:carboxylesterase 5A-like [Mytilus californianus]